MKEEIKSEFRKSGFDLDEEEEILNKCLTFCINYSLSPSDLVSSWEVYYLNRFVSSASVSVVTYGQNCPPKLLNGSTVQNAEMDGFLLHLQNNKKEDVIMEEAGLHTYSIRDAEIYWLLLHIKIDCKLQWFLLIAVSCMIMLLSNDDETRDNAPGTPTDHHQDIYSPAHDTTPLMYGNVLSSGKPSKLVTPFSKRTDRFAVKFSINTMPDVENGMQEPNHENVENDEDDVIKKVLPRKRCSLVVHGSGPKQGCRFMYDRTEDRLNAIENRIKKHTRALVASGLYEEPTDPTIASQGIHVQASLLIHLSVEHSGGECVRLDLGHLSHFSVFPGQVVGIGGHNPSGHCLVASKLVDSIPISVADKDLNPAKKQAIDKENQPTDLLCEQRELSMIIAAGPFTTTDNLLFEPLVELLAYAKRRPPQLLVLLGPFIDSEHPDIKKGITERSFDELFRFEVLRKPALDISLPDLKSQIVSLTNPGIFEANEVKIGCCTVDILKQVSGEEISRTAADGKPSDRLSRLANHILNQQSFYPLYPPAESVPLDFSLAPEALQLSLVPDVLILPSDIKYFVKVLNSESEGISPMKCIAVNPGRLAKGEGGGTFVELDFGGGPDKINASIVGI
ncbi:DNA-polymerase alpha/epsilon, subunit B [Sesbania bispinosa]|nr:DNA-polymerase alpha/epsilon, subunit B [Sesbania bispinosa]